MAVTVTRPTERTARSVLAEEMPPLLRSPAFEVHGVQGPVDSGPFAAIVERLRRHGSGAAQSS